MIKELIVLLSFFSIIGSSVATPVTSAQIEKTGNRLVVTFRDDVEVGNAEGFRLVGGTVRIEKLLSGNRSNRLVFQLTGHALPDDQFNFIHWQEVSTATIANTKLEGFEQPVVNNVEKYAGSGVLYYVSTSGNDGDSGRSPSTPFRTFARAHAVVQPGDFILLKRGDTWDRTNIVITRSGTADNYLTVGAYGKGERPVIFSRGLTSTYKGYRVTGATLAVQGADYVHLDNLHIKTDISVGGGGADDGIQLLDCKYAVVSNCTAESPESGGYFGIRVNTWVYDKAGKEAAIYNNTYPQVLNCEVFGYLGNIGTQIWPYDGRHTIYEGGTIENCISRDPLLPKNGGNVWENIMINRGDFHGFVIRKNQVYGFRSNGLEVFGSKNVIIEYNEVFDPANYKRGGRGIKAGGYNDANQTAPGVGELYSENIIVRYNKVYNITQGGDKGVDGIDVNNSRSGEVYGNLVYNVKGIGIKITGKLDKEGWKVYNNTVLNCGEDALQLYTDGPYAANVLIENNILEGKWNDINCMLNGNPGNATGRNNILLNGKVSGSYVGKSDVKPNKDVLFVDRSRHNYQLKPNSYAVNQGISIEGFVKGIDGNPTVKAPDIGAYQFVQGELPPSPAPQPSPSPAPEPDPAPEPSPSPAPEPKPLPSPSPSPSPGSDANQGLRYRYYHGSWRALPDFANLEAVKSGTVTDFSLEPRTQEDDYGFLFEGYIQIKQAGKYTFYTSSDDGSKLWVNEKLLVDNDGLHALRERLGVVYLTEGYHPIRVTFFDRKYADGLLVSYEATGVTKQAIPGDVLFTNAPSRSQQPELIATAQTVRADAGGDRKLSSGTESVSLHGRGQGPHPFRRYDWEKISGPDVDLVGQNTANAYLHKPVAGTYVFRFTAVDSEGNQGSDEMRLEISDQATRTTYQANKLGNDASDRSADVKHKIRVYPNPIKDVINLATTSGDTSLPFRLFNQHGQVVHSGEVAPQAERASIQLLKNHLKSGIYVLKLYSEQLGTQTIRLLKE